MLGYPLHSPLSPSLLLPCVVVCHQIPFPLYHFNVYSNLGCIVKQTTSRNKSLHLLVHAFFHSYLILSYDWSINSSEVSSPQSARWFFLFQFSVSSLFFVFIQLLLMSSSSSSHNLYHSLHFPFNKVL